MAAELVAAKVDLIVVWSTVAALAEKKATQTIPIVMVRVADPVGAGSPRPRNQPGHLGARYPSGARLLSERAPCRDPMPAPG